MARRPDLKPLPVSRTAIGEVVTSLGLPSKLRDIDFERSRLSEVAELLVENYPREVDDLGPHARARLSTLLESLW